MITSEQARPYFEHPSQQLFGITPDSLPDEPFQYWADGPVCGIFHPGPYEGVWMGHFAVIPEGRGRLTEPAKRILRDFSVATGYPTIMGWTPSRLRPALAFVKRLGFNVTGEFMANGELITITTWRLRWA